MEAIRANLQVVGGDTRGLVCRDALAFLREAPAEPFDVVFLDPPFREGLLAEALDRLAARAWLASGASLYIECERSLRPAPPPGWTLARSASAGQVGYHLARPEPREGIPHA
jgi:16S rRNA (guanine966-N2)-methyltransferase